MKEQLKQQILMKSHFYGTFVGVWYQMRDAKTLLQWASSQGLTDVTELEDVHTTIHYSKKGNRGTMREAKGKIFTVETAGLELLGENEDILVVRVVSDELERLHENLKNNYGLEYDFPEYKPHITIKYDFQGDINELELPEMELQTTKIHVQANKPKIN